MQHVELLKEIIIVIYSLKLVTSIWSEVEIA